MNNYGILECSREYNLLYNVNMLLLMSASSLALPLLPCSIRDGPYCTSRETQVGLTTLINTGLSLL